MGIQRLCVLGLLGCVFAAAAQVEGGVIPVANVDWSGSRSQSLGKIIGAGNVWGGAQHEFVLNYEVTQVGSTYTYSYTISDYTTQAAGLSHFVITTSDGLNHTTAFTLANVLPGTTGFGTNDLEVGLLNAEQGFGAPTEPYGIKFDLGDEPGELGFPPTYVLVTDRAPIWGSFFAKGGGLDGNWAFNTGWSDTGYYLALEGANFNANHWIPVPDSITTGVIPEPTSLAIFAGLALGTTGMRRRKRAGQR